MPVNATPEYEKAEARYRAAVTPAEQLEAMQEMLRLIPKHKGSEKVQAGLKRKISALRKDQAHAGRVGAAVVDPFYVPTGGAGQIVLAGAPNTGKSSIVAAVTNAPVKVADYPFTTAHVVPGMWGWQDVQFQLVDTPPLSEAHVEGGMVNLLHRADAVLLVVDLASPECLEQAETVLGIFEQRGLRLYDLPDGEIPDEVPFGKPGLLVATHVDAAAADDLATLRELYADRLAVAGVACPQVEGFDELAEHLWRLLDLVRVYTKRPGQPADMKSPFTLPTGSTVEDLARAIHRDLPQKMKFARIWGTNRHDGQQVHRTEELRDRDIVELHE